MKNQVPLAPGKCLHFTILTTDLHLQQGRWRSISALGKKMSCQIHLILGKALQKKRICSDTINPFLLSKSAHDLGLQQHWESCIGVLLYCHFPHNSKAFSIPKHVYVNSWVYFTCLCTHTNWEYMLSLATGWPSGQNCCSTPTSIQIQNLATVMTGITCDLDSSLISCRIKATLDFRSDNVEGCLQPLWYLGKDNHLSW